MPIDDVHADYEKRKAQWERIRDSIEGVDAVKARGQAYLPKLGGQNLEAYHAYQTRADFYDAPHRTLMGLVGMVFRKAPTTSLPSSLEALAENVDHRGQNLETFAKYIVTEVFAMGRTGVLVDVAVEHTDLIGPYFVPFAAEQIKNWRVGIVNGKPTLEQLVLHEMVPTVPRDGIGTVEIEQYRLYQLIDGGAHFQIWRKQENTDKFVPMADPMPMLVRRERGVPMAEIPFVPIGPTTLEMTVEKSPMLGVCDVALSHYRSSADLEQGRHFTALPTPWISNAGGALGDDGATPQFVMGGGHAWLLPRDSEAGMLEYTGQGLAALEKAMAEKEDKMAALGSRLLEDQKKGVEAAETVGRRQSGEHSVAASIADTCGRGLLRCFELAAAWMRIDFPNDSHVRLNKDFYPAPMTPEMIQAQMSMLQGGAMPWTQFVENMQRGEIFDAGKTPDQILDDINTSRFTLPGATFDDDADQDPPEDRDDDDQNDGTSATSV